MSDNTNETMLDRNGYAYCSACKCARPKTALLNGVCTDERWCKKEQARRLLAEE